MSSKQTCDHTIAFKYGEAYGTDSGYSISLSEFTSDLNYYEKNIKSDDFYECTYCPDCGKKLDKIIEKAIVETKEAIKQRKEQERLEKEKREKIFLEKVQVMMDKTKLSKLQDNQNYFVSFKSFAKYETRDTIMTGTPEYLARNLVHHLRGQELPEDFSFKKVVTCPTKEEFYKACEKAGWTIEGNSVTKVENERKTVLDYTEGMTYVHSFPLDDESDKNYDRGSVVGITTHFNIPMELEEIKL